MMALNTRKYHKSALIVWLLLMLLLVGCDYVANNNNIYAPLLSDADYQILNDSDPIATYQFDYEGELSLRLGLESNLVILEGSGVLEQLEDDLVPNMQFTMSMRVPANGSEATIELLIVDSVLYQRTVSPTDPTLTTDWIETPFTDVVGTFGVGLPSPGEDLDEDILTALNTAEDLGLAGNSSIVRLDDEDVGGVLSAHFLIENDLKAFFFSDAFLPLLTSSLFADTGIDPASLTPADLQANLDLLDAYFKILDVRVDQYVDLDTGLQNRAITELIWETDPAAVGSPAGGSDDLTISVYIDTRYRDYYEPVTIAVPTAVTVASPAPATPTLNTPNVEDLSPDLAQTNLNVEIDPLEINAEICNIETIQSTINVTLPPREAEGLDVVVVLDVSSSMNDEITEVKRTIAAINDELQLLVPDTRIAVVTFSDHPASTESSVEGDSPYTLVSDFTSDIDQLESTIGAIALETGGFDIDESTLYALYQSAQLGWRSNALRIAILFTDAPPHVVDAGADGVLDTADDLTPDDVISILQGRGIRVVSIQSSSVAGRNSGATEFLTDLSNSTNGVRETLTNASEIPDVVIGTISGLVGGDLGFVSNQQGFRFADNPVGRDWIEFSPATFAYPTEGGVVPVQMTISPSRARLLDGSYTLTLDLRDNVTLYGQVIVDFDYTILCSNIVVADTSIDDGIGCSVSGPQDLSIYWESPDIIVRTTNNFVERSEKPNFGATNYVWVRVTNLGPRDSGTIQLGVFASTNPFEVREAVRNAPVAANAQRIWEPIGEESFALVANGSEWRGPFAFVPQDNGFALRAVVETIEDRVQAPNDFACDGNIAQQNYIYATLDVPSYGERLIGGEIPFRIQAPDGLTYNTLDFRLGNTESTNGLVRLSLDADTYTAWQDQQASYSGGSLVSPGVFLVTTNELFLDDLVGGPSVTIDARLAIATNSGSGGQMPLSLRAVDRTVLGATIVYDIDTTSLPTNQPPDPTVQPERPQWQQYAFWIPVVIAMVLLFLWGGIEYFNRSR